MVLGEREREKEMDDIDERDIPNECIEGEDVDEEKGW
jgi:hypothetical protein